MKKNKQKSQEADFPLVWDRLYNSPDVKNLLCESNLNDHLYIYTYLN